MDLKHTISSHGEKDVSLGWKKGVRVLGVAESFEKSDKKSFMVGIVMRGDFQIDGFGVCNPTIGGKDSTNELLALFSRMKRKDIRAWMLGGNVVSWFNIIDIVELNKETGLPVICISYHPSDGIEKYLKEYFPDDWEVRNEILKASGERISFQLGTEHTLFLSAKGIGLSRAKRLVDQFTVDGRVPEPIRVARTIAAGLKRDLRV
ncbi:MAG: DUF99 family protein [Candidatus Thorarchaeota archaeon]